MKSVVGDREIVASGCVVYFQNEELYVYPFQDDPDFKLRIELSFVEEAEKERSHGFLLTSVDDGKDKGVTLKACRVFKNPTSFSPSKPFNFASDATHEFFVSLSVLVFGRLESHTLTVNYTVTQEAH